MINLVLTARAAVAPAARCLAAFALLMLAVDHAHAQTTTTSAVDGTTPLGLSRGAPAGSYSLGGFESVNLYNGNLNFRLPLLQIGGRGGGQTVMMLALNTKGWHVKHTVKTIQGETIESFSPSTQGWAPSDVDYGPGALSARQSGIFPIFCSFSSPPRYVRTLTRLTFRTADGTEYDLRDQQTGGQPLPPVSCTLGASRGTIFVSANGEAATFIADSPIVDKVSPSAAGTVNCSGFLLLRDGTRYRIDGGKITWIRDRNGNRLSFAYGTNFNDLDSFNRVISVTDSLNRQVTIQYKQTDQTYGLVDRISFKGFGGAARTISIALYGNLSSFLRSTTPVYSTQTLKQLFPELNGAQTTYNPTVVSAVYLPDGRSFQFRYNPYGEVEQVVLPTGGAIEYRMAPGSGAYPTYADAGNYQIFRRVAERHVYLEANNAASLQAKTVYTASFSTPFDPRPWSTTVTVDNLDAGNTLLGRSKHYFARSGLAGLFQYEANFYPAADEGQETKTELFDTNETTLLRRTTNTFARRDSVWWWPAYAAQQHLDLEDEPGLDERLTVLKTTLDLSGANQVSKQEYDYDQYNNKTVTREYDFGTGSPGGLVRRVEVDYLTTMGGNNYATDTGIHLRSLPTSERVYAGSSTSPAAETQYEYDNYTPDPPGNQHADLVARASITGLDSGFGTSKKTRGNVTAVKRWLNTTNTFLNTYSQYDVVGNVVKTIDPRSTATNIIATTFDFDDRYGVPDDEARSNTAPAELTNPPLTTYALVTKVTNALGHVGYTQYDYYLGKGVNGEDANGAVTSGRYGGFGDGTYTDKLDRPTELIDSENSAALKRRTRFTYNDAGRMITTQSDQTTLTDGILTSAVVYDGLGHTTETRTAAPEGTIYETQEYDGLGRVKRSYNPFRTTSDETFGYADTSYDGLGRVKTVTTTDNSIVTTTYSGNTTMVTDQAGKKRRSVVDGLGRLIRVDEPDSAGNLDNTANPPQPLQPTSYAYDALGNLIQVNQGGQQRSFTYDSLSRLKSAKNPEQVSGVVQVATNYDYDAASNVLSKSGPNSGSSVSFSYDGLNRVKTKTLSSGGTWDYAYDTATTVNAKGRLVSVVLHGGTDGYYYDGYDGLGRVMASRQITTADLQARTYSMSYEYDLAGNMKKQVYPSGKAFVTEYDSASRIAGVKKDGAGYYAGATPTDATNRIQYGAHGAVSGMKFGNQKWEHTIFNSRLQPVEIGLGATSGASDLLKLEYTYSNSNPAIHDNNGNVLSQKITAPKTGGGNLVLTQTYGYDKLNRLSDATETGGTNEWSQTYSYDRFGNRAVVGGTVLDGARTPQSLSAFDTVTNRIKPSVMPGFGYDTAGNVTSDPFTSANGIVYDTENRQTAYGTSSYSYDGDGRRVKKQVGSVTTVFVYNVVGQLIAEYDNSTSPPVGSGTSYLTSDHLGSTRVVMKSDGTVARHDYLPFGEETPSAIGGRGNVAGYSATDSTHQKFTQKERDNESGLDYFISRYYSSAQGRFTSADSVPGAVGNPQTFNLYTYVLNNPLRLIDATGHWPSLSGLAFPTAENWQRYQEDQSLTFSDIGLGPLFQEQVTILPEFDQIAAQPADPSLLGSLNRSIANTFGVGITAAITADHTATGPNAAIWQAMQGYLFIGGVLSGSSAGSLLRLGVDVAAQQAVGQGVELTAGYVFRGGSATPDNLTPRPGVDTKGLSTFDNLESATPPGGKAQVIDVGRLSSLRAVPDSPPGHVSLTPGSPQLVKEWAATRGTGKAHPYTKEIIDAIVSVARRVK